MNNNFKDALMFEAEAEKDKAKDKSKWQIRVYWIAGVFTAFIFALMIIAAWHIIIKIAPYVVGTISAVAILFTLWKIYELIQDGKTRHVKHNAERRIINAKADEAEAEARAAALFKYGRAEGVIQHFPDSLKMIALPANVASSNMIVDGASTFDFYELMTQTKRAYALFGGQQTGKSTKMHHIIRHWQDRGIGSVVIGQKFDAHEYNNGVMRFGPDADSILEGFELVRNEAKARQELASNGMSFSDMTPLPVVLEDATSLATVIDKNDYDNFARQVLTVYAARNITTYYVVHSTDLTAFGLKASAALKNHLVCLYFTTPADMARYSLQDVTITGSIGYTSKVDERIVVGNLPYGFASLTDDCEPGLYSLKMDMASVDPSRVLSLQDRNILRMYGRGSSVSEIADGIFGQKNGYNTQKVKDVLAKFDIPIRDGRTRENE